MVFYHNAKNNVIGIFKDVLNTLFLLFKHKTFKDCIMKKYNFIFNVFSTPVMQFALDNLSNFFASSKNATLRLTSIPWLTFYRKIYNKI